MAVFGVPFVRSIGQLEEEEKEREKAAARKEEKRKKRVSRLGRGGFVSGGFGSGGLNRRQPLVGV